MEETAPLRLGLAGLFAIGVFSFRIAGVTWAVVVILLGLGSILLAGYHSYDGGSAVTTVLIPVVTMTGWVLAVGIDDARTCPPIPGCMPGTPAGVYAEWMFGATALGVGVYLSGRVLRKRFAGS